VLLACGITGTFGTWKGVPHACMRDDIEKTAGLTVAKSSVSFCKSIFT
jgi:hypothetical protein